MTSKEETTKATIKEKPAFYIFSENSEGVSEIVGAAFLHKKGNGMNILINEIRYSAFPPKQNTPT